LTGDRQLRTFDRASALNPDTIDYVDSFAWNLLRHGKYKQGLEEIFSKRSKFEKNEFHRVCKKHDNSFFESFISSLTQTRSLNENRSRAGFIRAMVEFLEAADKESPTISKQVSFVEDLFHSQKIELIHSSKVYNEMSKARRGQDAPRRGIMRLIFLMILREGMPHKEKMGLDEFDKIIGQGQSGLREKFSFNWVYDFNHMRRYLVQFGMVMRTTDGRQYWRSQKCLDTLVLTEEAKSLISGWWQVSF
jgi:hypothetical protein